MRRDEGDALAVGLEEAPGRAVRLANELQRRRAAVRYRSPLPPEPARAYDPVTASGADVPDDEGLGWRRYFDRACGCLDRSQYHLSITLLIRVVNRNEGHFDAWYRLGFAYGELKRHQRAIECFDRAIALDRGSAEAWANRGWNRLQIRDYHEAIQDLLRAIELNLQTASAHANLGIAYAKLGAIDKAVEALKLACFKEPDNEYHHYRLARVASKSGDRILALESFRRACELNPLFALAWLHLAVRARHASDWPRSASLCHAEFEVDAGAWNMGKIIHRENPLADMRDAKRQERLARAWAAVQNPVAWILIFVVVALLYILLGN